MNAIEGFFRRPIPDQLFHYTSVGALGGIIASHCMWCTDAAHMNDTSELWDAQPRAEKAIQNYSFTSETQGLRSHVQKFFSSEYAGGFLAQEVSQYFLMCFTLLDDDLNQWCRYADDARGVCIGFDLNGLRPPAIADTLVTFAPCVYTEPEKFHLLNQLIADFEARHQQTLAMFTDKQQLANHWANFQINNPNATRREFQSQYPERLIYDSVNKLRYDFIRLCCHFKNKFFQSEGEWRLVLPHLRKNDFKKTIVREVAGRVHAEFTFEGYEKLPITSVRLGAGTDEIQVRQILEAGNYNVPITRSSIPYRPKPR